MKKLINIQNLFLGQIFFLPFYLVPIKIGIISTNLWECLFILLFFGWLIKRWSEINFRSILKRNKNFIFPVSAIILGLVLSTFFSDNIWHGLGIIKSWFFVPVILLMMISEEFRGKNKLNIFYAYYFSAAGVAIASLGYLFIGDWTYDGRLQAFFNSPNYLAMYLAPALITGLAQVKSLRMNIKSFGISFFYYLSFLSIVVVLYFTFSYAAWAAVIISVQFLFRLAWKIKVWKLAANLILTVGLILFIQSGNDKFLNLINYSSHSSLASRAMIWKASARIIEDNLFIGIGPANFQKTYLEYQKHFPPYLEWAVPHPHNLFLAFWLYGGLFGLGGFLALLVIYIGKIGQKLATFNSPEAKKFIIISVCILVYILTHGLLDTTYFKNDLAVVFWLTFLPFFD